MAYQDVQKRIRECKKCGQIKSFDEFHKDRSSKLGIRSSCKVCVCNNLKSKYIKKIDEGRTCNHCGKHFVPIYNNNKYCSEQCLKTYIKNNKKPSRINKGKVEFICSICGKLFKTLQPNQKTCSNECKKKYRSIKQKEYDKNNPDIKNKAYIKYRKTEKRRKVANLWAKRNNHLRSLYRRTYQNEKYKTDPNYKTARLLRARLSKLLKTQKTKKRSKTLDLIGCSINEFCKHIENQFDENMSWDNHGTYWHLDHIYPLSKADLTKESEIKRVMHYSNFQPLEAIENIRKSNKLNWRKS